jgi:SAM-dependent methyltransferase
MAPRIALGAVAQLPAGSVVLDPMAGSGTVLRAAADHGLRAIGYDLDPLAILMARVWNAPVDASRLLDSGYQLLNRYDAMDHRAGVSLPWIDNDLESKQFIDKWFARKQRAALRQISSLLRLKRGPIADALRVALSTTIIRKEGGASLADDVSHSRPHVVRCENEYDVADGFELAVRRLARILEQQPPKGNVDLHNSDGRALNTLRANSIDAIISSPPYLNAIDYMRGHRLSLVWLGYQIRTLRHIRRISIGTEYASNPVSERWMRNIKDCLGDIHLLPNAQQRMIDRYIVDLRELLLSCRRVLKPKGTALFVVGDSCLRDVFIRNSAAFSAIAGSLGFILLDQRKRSLPARHRYLPPPSRGSSEAIKKRIRTEVVLTFQNSG